MRDAKASDRKVALLMTRPPAASARFVAQLPPELLVRLTVLEAPLLEIKLLELEAGLSFDGYLGVIFTSANGVTTAGVPPQGLPAYCIGARTTQAATEAGWQAQNCGATAAELCGSLQATPPPVPLLHLHGRHTRGEVAETLTAAGLLCEGRVIYEQRLLPLEPEIRQQIGAQSDVVVPLFSPRTARHFASLGLDQRNLTLIALSQAVAEELKGLNYKDLQVSKMPDAPSMAVMVRDAAVRLAHLEGGKPAQ
ncbi:uroporphyrinogen-III synthase [Pseudophaeobacter sp.]|uniref:uroporphyrinogen-III synthase n=1 Tax=Pseudophaeobacter sp. TaxID=1971739 RepID=UPI003299D7E6